jgi:hypothetical protein
MNQFRKPKSGGSQNQQVSTLIHSCQFKKQLPALGQYWIGRVGQYSIGANKSSTHFDICQLKQGPERPALTTVNRTEKNRFAVVTHWTAQLRNRQARN